MELLPNQQLRTGSRVGICWLTASRFRFLYIILYIGRPTWRSFFLWKYQWPPKSQPACTKFFSKLRKTSAMHRKRANLFRVHCRVTVTSAKPELRKNECNATKKANLFRVHYRWLSIIIPKKIADEWYFHYAFATRNISPYLYK